MKVHLIIGIFALLLICCAVAYVAFGPESASAATSKLPGEPVSGEPVKTNSGLKYYDLKVGTGPSPAGPTSTVRVKYAGYLTNGTKFDSSDSTSFELDRVIGGWTEGVGSMKVGGKRKLIIPPDLGYKYQWDQGHKIPPGSTLIFDIELLELPAASTAVRPPMSLGARPPMGAGPRPPMSAGQRPPLPAGRRPPISTAQRPPVAGGQRPPTPAAQGH